MVEDNDEQKVEGKGDDGKGVQTTETEALAEQQSDCWYLFAQVIRLKGHKFILGMYMTINPSLKLAKGLGGCFVFGHP